MGERGGRWRRGRPGEANRAESKRCTSQMLETNIMRMQLIMRMVHAWYTATASVGASIIRLPTRIGFVRKYCSQGRGNGGGAVGETCPHNLGAVGAPPPSFGLSMSFIFTFGLFLHVNLGLSPQKSRPYRVSFCFG